KGKEVVAASRKELAAKEDALNQEVEARRGNIQRWQELGGLTGRILFAVLLLFVPSRWLLRLFLVPGVILFPLTYLELVKGEYWGFGGAVFVCGLRPGGGMSEMGAALAGVVRERSGGCGGAVRQVTSSPAARGSSSSRRGGPATSPPTSRR